MGLQQGGTEPTSIELCEVLVGMSLFRAVLLRDKQACRVAVGVNMLVCYKFISNISISLLNSALISNTGLILSFS